MEEILIDSEKALKSALLMPKPNKKYKFNGKLQYELYPAAAELLSSYLDCDLISNGNVSLKCVSIRNCNLLGSFNLFGCDLHDCNIWPSKNGMKYLSIIGGSLHKVSLNECWNSVNFGPNHTNSVTFENSFLALELILRINCAVMAGIKKTEINYAKILAALSYGEEPKIPNAEIVRACQNLIDKKIKEMEE